MSDGEKFFMTWTIIAVIALSIVIGASTVTHHYITQSNIGERYEVVLPEEGICRD